MFRCISVVLSSITLVGLTQAAPRIIPYGNDFVIMPRRLMPIAADEEPSSDFRQQIFLNFDGAKLVKGGNDAKTNKTALIAPPTHDYPALNWERFGGKEAGSKEVLAELKLLFGSYAAEFVTARPASGNYTMVMIGGRGENVAGGGGAVGVSPLDCNNDDRNEIVLVFGELLDTTKQLAFVIAHELGHSFGLEHVSDPKGIMHPALKSETCCWVSSGLSEGSTCGRKSQDANEVLLDNLGAGPGDRISPLVWIVQPGTSATMPPNFTFEVAAADDLRVHSVALFVDGKKKISMRRPPFLIALNGLSDGEHELRADVYDWKPNVSSTKLTITVDSKCPAEGSCFVGGEAIGSKCSDAGDCSSGLCVIKGEADDGVCAIECMGEKGSCPDDTSCQQLADDWICLGGGDGYRALQSTGNSGGCSVVNVQNPLLLLLICLLVVARRTNRQ